MTKRIKAHCNECGEVNHEVLHEDRTGWSAADDVVNGGTISTMLKCSGCDLVKLQSLEWNSEQDVTRVTYSPPAAYRNKPDWFHLLRLELDDSEQFVDTLLGEIYVALQNDLLNLAVMGVRSLLEKIMISKTGDLHSFDKHIAAFESLGYVSTIEAKRLKTVLEAGHAAIHRSFKPAFEDVLTSVDIAEHIIATVYVHEKPVADLSSRVPPRPSKPPKASKPANPAQP